jgi:hypothetical protein
MIAQSEELTSYARNVIAETQDVREAVERERMRREGDRRQRQHPYPHPDRRRPLT